MLRRSPLAVTQRTSLGVGRLALTHIHIPFARDKMCGCVQRRGCIRCTRWGHFFAGLGVFTDEGRRVLRRSLLRACSLNNLYISCYATGVHTCNRRHSSSWCALYHKQCLVGGAAVCLPAAESMAVGAICPN